MPIKVYWIRGIQMEHAAAGNTCNYSIYKMVKWSQIIMGWVTFQSQDGHAFQTFQSSEEQKPELEDLCKYYGVSLSNFVGHADENELKKPVLIFDTAQDLLETKLLGLTWVLIIHVLQSWKERLQRSVRIQKDHEQLHQLWHLTKKEN